MAEIIAKICKECSGLVFIRTGKDVIECPVCKGELVKR